MPIGMSLFGFFASCAVVLTASNPINAKNNKINVLSANNVSTPFGKLPQQFTYKVASTFSSGVSELDYNYVFIPYNDALEFIKNNKNLISVDIKIN